MGEDIAQESCPGGSGIIVVMPFSASCPACSLALHVAEQGIEAGLTRAVAFCPKCGHREYGPPRAGWIEGECEFHLHVDLPLRLSVAQVKALRAAIPELGRQPAADVLARLRTLRELTLGPFHARHEVDGVRKRLADAGLAAVVR